MVEVGIVKVADWPLALRLSWEAGIRPPVLPNDPCGAGGKWRKQTVDTTAASVGRYVHFGRTQDWPIDRESLEKLVTPSRLSLYLAHLAKHNAPATVLHRIVGLERGLAVMAPKAKRALLRLVIADLENHFEPASKREKLQESAALAALGVRLMEDVKAGDFKNPRKSASVYRDGLQTAFLARRPLRLRNLSMMVIGRHIVKTGGVWRIAFAGHEVKNGKPINVLFPEDLVEPLEIYLAKYRLDLAGSNYTGNGLWVSYCFRQQAPGSIRDQLCKRTEDAFGLPITPHLFRDCAATSLSVNAPEIVGIAHLVLGNTYAVMKRYYNLARVVEAGRHFYSALGLD